MVIQMLLVLTEANKKGNKENVFHVYREETKSRKYRTIKRKFTTGEVRTYGHMVARRGDENSSSSRLSGQAIDTLQTRKGSLCKLDSDSA